MRADTHLVLHRFSYDAPSCSAVTQTEFFIYLQMHF